MTEINHTDIIRFINDALSKATAEHANDVNRVCEAMDEKISHVQQMVLSLSQEVTELKAILAAMRSQSAKPQQQQVGSPMGIPLPTTHSVGLNPGGVPNGAATRAAFRNRSASTRGLSEEQQEDRAFKDCCREISRAYLDLNKSWSLQDDEQRRHALARVQEAHPRASVDEIRHRFRKYLTHVKSYQRKQNPGRELDPNEQQQHQQQQHQQHQHPHLQQQHPQHQQQHQQQGQPQQQQLPPHQQQHQPQQQQPQHQQQHMQQDHASMAAGGLAPPAVCGPDRSKHDEMLNAMVHSGTLLPTPDGGSDVAPPTTNPSSPTKRNRPTGSNQDSRGGGGRKRRRGGKN